MILTSGIHNAQLLLATQIDIAHIGGVKLAQPCMGPNILVEQYKGKAVLM